MRKKLGVHLLDRVRLLREIRYLALLFMPCAHYPIFGRGSKIGIKNRVVCGCDKKSERIYDFLSAMKNRLVCGEILPDQKSE